MMWLMSFLMMCSLFMSSSNIIAQAKMKANIQSYPCAKAKYGIDKQQRGSGHPSLASAFAVCTHSVWNWRNSKSKSNIS